MKKIIASSVLGFSVLFGVISGTTNTAHADVVETVASSTPMYQGGFGTTCFYLRQIHEGEMGYVCNDSDPATSPEVFASNPVKREQILINWRARWLVPHN